MDVEEKPGAVDLMPSRRPGVPKEEPPHRAAGVHWDAPEPQVARVPILKHRGRKELPPVFGSAQPPRGLSGAIRRWAYAIPEQRARHWLLLLFADRVDVVESRLASPGGVALCFAAGLSLGLALRER